MDRLLFPVFVLLAHWLQPRFNARLRFLEAQIRMLRSRVDGNRIVPTPEEKDELLCLGASLDHDVGEVLHVVQARAYRRWLRDRQELTSFTRSGRPRIPEALRRLVIHVSGENAQWGYRRILGELKKLGFSIGASTIRKILREAGITPEPNPAAKVASIPWKTFIQANMESIVATDFFTKPVHTFRGTFTAYVLVFIHLGSRKTFCSPATYHPDAKWVVQQSRNSAMWLDENGIQPRFILQDRDTKFSDYVRDFWRSEGARPLRTPVQAPKANAFVESFIGTLKRECLNYFVCFSRNQLDYILRTWIAHYNTERPHRGIGMNNEVLDKGFRPRTHGPIRCKQQLGGLIKSYYRDAA